MAGYSHTYFEDDDTPSNLFSQFPSDQTIDSVAKVAYDEAIYLWSLLSYDPCETPTDHKSQPGNSVPVSEGFDIDDPHEEPVNAAISDRRELLSALEDSSDTPGCSQKSRKNLNEYMFAAAALNLQDFNNMCALCIWLFRERY